MPESKPRVTSSCRRAAWFLVLLLAACTPEEPLAVAERSVLQFHERLNSTRFDAIYDSAGDEFRRAGRKEDIISLLVAVHSKLGTVLESKRTKWTVNHHTSGTFVTLIHQTRFERDSAAEHFLFRIGNGEARLVGYKIDSPLLAIR